MNENHLKICHQIADAGGKPFIVGGFVRDTLRRRKPNDVDLMVVGLTPEGMEQLFPGNRAVGNLFPVWIIDGFEVALARTEKKNGEGHTGFICETANVSLVEDLSRRDLTVNAMAMDPFTGEIFDFFNGREDLASLEMRPIGKHFREDPLRVVRAARLAAKLGMIPTDDLIEECKHVLSELQSLPQERVFEELKKALGTNHPSVFFQTLDELGALTLLFPEIAALKGRTQPEKHHPEGDAYVHTLLVIDRAVELGADEATVFAALTHDLGKAVTDTDNLPHHYGHEGLGVPLVEAMSKRLRVPTKWCEVAKLAALLHLNVHRFEELKPVKKVRLITGLQRKQAVEQVALVAQADAQGRGPALKEKPYPQRQRLLDAADEVRKVKGDKFSGLRPEVIGQKMEQERAKALKLAGF
jgi:tRNA nucleotidyltransferase (CCA-adding enzyme)